MTTSNDFSLADKVKLSDFYLTNYCGVAHLKDAEAEVVGIKKHTVKASDLRLSPILYLYVEKYGSKDVYDAITLLIKYPNINMTYIVSAFGVVKCKDI